jgi:hypothetical protein
MVSLSDKQDMNKMPPEQAAPYFALLSVNEAALSSAAKLGERADAG